MDKKVKQIALTTIVAIVGWASAGIVGNYSYYLLDIKNEEILRLTEKIISLERQEISSKKELSNIHGKINIVSDTVSQLTTGSTTQAKLNAIDIYRGYVRELKIVQFWEEQNNIAITSLSRDDESYSKSIKKSLILDSMESICEGYTFHLWFAEKTAYNLPILALIGMAELFNSIQQSCLFVPRNVKRIKYDSWYADIAFGISGESIISYPMIEENYNSIMRSINYFLRLLSEEQHRLK